MQKMRLITAVLLLTACGFTAKQVNAAPWLKTDDPYLQQSLQLLANAGLLKTPINTWPVMWQPVLQDLANIDTTKLTPAQLQAYYRIQAAASFTQKSAIHTVALQASNEPVGIQSFGKPHQQEAMISLGTEVKGSNWSGGLYKQFRQDSFDATQISENPSHWDNSYGAYTIGNWVVIAAIQPQWWGPTNDSSFHFNNQQRAPRSLQLSRLNPTIPLHNALDWLGPVSFNVQYGKFAGTAPLRHATYLATRVGLAPHTKIEIGFTGRTIEPEQNALTLTESYSQLLPQDTLTTLGADVRYHLNSHAAVYAELSQQQSNDTDLKSANGYVIGSHYHLGSQDVLLRFFTEYQSMSQHYNQWLFIQPGTNNRAFKSQWVAGVHISTPTGQAGYIKFSQRKYSNGYNVPNNALNITSTEQSIKSNRVAVGYQHPLFKGLLQLDYHLEKDDNMAQSNADNSNAANNSSEFNHAVGARWEWRW